MQDIFSLVESLFEFFLVFIVIVMVRPLLSNVSYELTVKLWQRLNVNKEIVPFYLIKMK